MNAIGALVFWRFFVSIARIIAYLVLTHFQVGVGIGGDYPLSAVISSEFAPIHLRGRLISAVFSFQGWGQLVASIVACIVVAGFKNGINGDVSPDFIAVDKSWRILIGMGCVPE